MRYIKSFTLLIVLTQSVLAVDYSVKGAVESKYYRGVVVTAPLVARAKPEVAAASLMVLRLGDLVSVVSQTAKWYGIQIQTPQGSILVAWVDKRGMQVSPPKTVLKVEPLAQSFEEKFEAAPSPKPKEVAVVDTYVPPRPPVKKNSRVKTALKNELSFLISPIFDVYQYGSFQQRVGFAYTRSISEQLALDVPISFAFGDGYQSVQGGLGGYVYFGQFSQGRFFARAAVMGERFYNEVRHFYAATADFGLGVRWLPSSQLGLSFEPLSVEYMGWNNQNVPENIRAQTILRVFYLF